MASKITPEQIADLKTHVGRPVPLENEAGDVVCYLIGANVFDDDSSEYHQQLQALIAEARNSPKVSAEVAHRLIREHTQELTEKNA